MELNGNTESHDEWKKAKLNGSTESHAEWKKAESFTVHLRNEEMSIMAGWLQSLSSDKDWGLLWGRFMQQHNVFWTNSQEGKSNFKTGMVMMQDRDLIDIIMCYDSHTSCCPCWEPGRRLFSIAQLMKESKIRSGGWRRKIQTGPILLTPV